MKDHADVSAVNDEHAEHTAKTNKPTDDYKHSFIVTGKPMASRVEQRGFLALSHHIVQPWPELEFVVSLVAAALGATGVLGLRAMRLQD